jgi:hypothetical protein
MEIGGFGKTKERTLAPILRRPQHQVKPRVR